MNVIIIKKSKQEAENMDFKDKVAVITGGAQGIGRCVAEEFQKAEATVCVIDKQQGDHYIGDIADKQVLEDLAKEVIKKHGHVDFLINNALPQMKGINECSYEEFQYALNVGVTAPFYLTKLFVLLTNYKINFKYEYKKDIFYFEEEPELYFDDSIFSIISIPNQNYYSALLFMFDLNEKESFDYILKSYEKIYSTKIFSSCLKVVVGNKNDLDQKLRQVNKEDVDNFVKKIKAMYFEISSKNAEQVYNILAKIYTTNKHLIRINQYNYGIANDNAYFIEKEKLNLFFNFIIIIKSL